MVRLTSLSQLKVYFPIRQLQAVAPRCRRQELLYVGRNLENRLITFALSNGARSAFLRQSDRTTMLVVCDGRGGKITTAITGTAAEWHQALDKLEATYDEDECAGLHRYLKPSAQLSARPRQYGLAA
jgi:hypothetical protein